MRATKAILYPLAGAPQFVLAFQMDFPHAVIFVGMHRLAGHAGLLQEGEERV